MHGMSGRFGYRKGLCKRERERERERGIVGDTGHLLPGQLVCTGLSRGVCNRLCSGRVARVLGKVTNEFVNIL